jgi:hypothetical protein
MGRRATCRDTDFSPSAHTGMMNKIAMMVHTNQLDSPLAVAAS